MVTNNNSTTKPKVSISSHPTDDTTRGTNHNSASGTNSSSNLYSYHNSTGAGDTTTSNPYEIPPTIHQYHDTTTSTLFRNSIGDSSLLPNIGRTNQYAEHALFGLAYHELVTRLQLSISLTAALVLVVLFLTWYVQLFQPIHLVLSVIVAILSLILLMVEGKMLWQSLFSTSSPPSFATASSLSSNTITVPATNATTTTNPTTIHVILKHLERTGTIILYHPIGKTLYLLTCSILCYSITGTAMFLFAILFFGQALTLVYCYVTYPECRKSFDSLQQQPSSTTTTTSGSTAVTDSEGHHHNVARSWSSYYSEIANTATVTSWVSERASLLRS